MRIRSIKPSWLEDERLCLLPPEARVMSIALILMADDEGRGRANPMMIGPRVFPGSRTFVEDSTNALRMLVEASFIVRYEVDGQSYYQIRNWKKHQRIDRPSVSSLPPAPDSKSAESFDSTNVRRTLCEDSASARRRKGREEEWKGKERRESARGGAHAREESVEVMRPELPGSDLDRARLHLVRGFQTRFEAAMRYPWPGHRRSPDPTDLATWMARVAVAFGGTAEEAIDHALDSWFAEEWPRKAKFPWKAFCAQAQRYFDAAPVRDEQAEEAFA